MGIFHCALLEIGRDADVMVGTDDEAGASRLRNCRIASISSGDASYSVTM
jgi:hypothetical protein